MNRTVTLSDVAREAGVSLGTASNTFNRPERVRQEVREQVEAAAGRLGYGGPDPVGRLLMGGKANAIGIIPPGAIPVATALRSSYFREFILGVAEICDAHEASMVLVSGDLERKQWAIRNALVDGFVLGHRDEVPLVAARRRKVPCIVMDMEAGDRASSIEIDARQGARLAAQHLLALGHRRFAILSVQRSREDPVYHAPGSPRYLRSAYPIDHEKLAGYAEALAGAGIPLDAVPLVETYPHQPDPLAGTRLLLDRAPETTAVLAMADRQAVRLLEEARRRGIAVPAELSVIGFDDAPEAAEAVPPLTTVAQPLVEKGRLAARMLFEGGVPRHEVLPVELVVRQSTAPPRVG